MTRISDFLQSASILLPHSSSARLDMELLLAELLKVSRSHLFTYPEQIISLEKIALLEDWIAQRQQGCPMAYLLEKRDFWNLTLTVNHHVLIPRPETELLVELALEKIKGINSPRILDLGTGSGAIALSIAQERPDAWVVAIDRKETAIQVAVNNAENYQFNNIKYVVSHWCDALAVDDEAEKFHLIVSNPPYIQSSDPHLQQGDVRFEPHSALIAEDNGLADLKKIIQQSQYYLLQQGVLLLEHGYDQGSSVRQLLAYYGYQCIVTYKDLADLERLTMGVYSGE